MTNDYRKNISAIWHSLAEAMSRRDGIDYCEAYDILREMQWTIVDTIAELQCERANFGYIFGKCCEIFTDYTKYSPEDYIYYFIPRTVNI